MKVKVKVKRLERRRDYLVTINSKWIFCKSCSALESAQLGVAKLSLDGLIFVS